MTSQSVGIPSPSSPGRGNLCCFSEKEWLDFRLQSLEVVVPPKVKSASKDACSVRNSQPQVLHRMKGFRWVWVKSLDTPDIG